MFDNLCKIHSVMHDSFHLKYGQYTDPAYLVPKFKI